MMSKKIFVVFFLLSTLCLVNASALVKPAHAQGPTTLFVDPTPKTAVVGTPFTVNVNVANVGGIGLVGFMVNMTFDRTLMRCVSVEAGSFLPGPVLITVNTISNAHGSFLIGGAATGGAGLGSGTLLVVTFICLGAGNSNLHFVLNGPQGTELLDAADNPIFFTATDGSVSQSYALFVDPTPKNAIVGTFFTVNVNVSNIDGNGLNTWQFNMTFNPTIIQCVSVTAGSFLPPPIIFPTPIIDNVHGWVLVAGSEQGMGAGFGSGTLAIATFSGLTSGDTDLHFAPYQTVMEDPDFNNIPFAAIDGHVHVQGTTLFVDPTPKNAVVGTDFTVDVKVENIVGAGLGRWAINMTFNPSVVQCVSIANGTFLPPPIKQWDPTMIDNTHGWVYAGTMLQTYSRVVGNGTLAVVTFHCLGPGDTVLHPIAYLANFTNGPISFTTIDGQVHQHYPPATLFVDPTPKNAVVGTDFTVNINVSNVAGNGLLGWILNMTFDPAIVQCVSIINGSFLPKPFPAFPTTIDNTNGWVAASTGTYGGTFGSGTLAVITFHCRGAGDSDLHFVLNGRVRPSVTELIDAHTQEIPFTAIDGHVHQYTAAPPSVGGVGIAANLFGLVATWMTVVSLIAGTAVSVGYFKHKKKQQ